MFETKITKILGIKHPIIMSGMTYVSLPKLVAAVSNAGGLGIYATSDQTADDVRENIRLIKSLTVKPFGANLPLLLPGADKLLQVLVDEKVPVVNYSLGKASDVAPAVHKYGGIVIGSVTYLKHAISAERGGADAVIVIGHEAGGHLGELSSLVLIPLVSSNVKIPVIAAGGFCDGKGLAAALALGAEGISMGTRFILTKECMIHEHMKQLILESNGENTIATDRFDGILCRFLKGEGLTSMIERRFSIKDVIDSAFRVKKIQGVSTWDLLGSAFKLRSAGIPVQRVGDIDSGITAIKAGIINGDDKNGVYTCGQVAARIEETPGCSELIERIVVEAGEVLGRMNKNLV
jgi:enoyl-[acyl-carrier protein] reductase II